MKNMNKNIGMICSICGNDQFTTIDESIEDMMEAPDDTKIKCSDCGRVVTKAQLIEENAEVIDAHVEELLKEWKKDIGKLFK